VNGILLDTHGLLWMVMEDSRLSKKARKQIEEAKRLTYSIVSFWEIALKLSRSGFDFGLPSSWHRDLNDEMRRIGCVRLGIEAEHCRHLQDLPWYHKDPFDRMLIAQAQVEQLSIMTADPRFKQYDVKVVW
jgi:PIN domain nuclease of toxin-antitoxin system